MGGPRVLYVSSSIGLGHATRDLAIASELRRTLPDLEILWLAGYPASDVLQEAGEHVIPEARQWVGATDIAEKCMKNGQLNLVRYVYRSLPSWAVNSRVVKAAIQTYGVDILVGDEAFEIDVPLVARLMRLKVPFVLILDFVGTDAMTRSLVDRVGAWWLNALWSLDSTVYNGHPHSAIFIGELDDVPDKRFGWALPNRRAHTRARYGVVGHAIGFRPEDYVDRAEVRKRLGYTDGPLVVCSVGGTSVGRDLLELCGRAYPLLRRDMPDLQLVLVCGPRIEPESVCAPAGAHVLGNVPRLYEHFACCDAAVVQCGGTSTTELAALRTPFVYLPIEGHFEQEAIAERLARHGIGTRISRADATPEVLAEAIREACGRTVAECAMPVDGARKAAVHILRAFD